MRIDKNTEISVLNKYNGTVGYDVPDLGVHRNFFPGERKNITFDELEKLSFTPGGNVILKEYLEIENKDVIDVLFNKQPQPEYFYTKEDIKKLMISGSIDQFLDCLDFAPEAVKEMIKDMAVELPLNDIAKRDAIQEKLGFNVTKAIEIKNAKFDSGDEDPSVIKRDTVGRRAATSASTPIRRYNVTKI